MAVDLGLRENETVEKEVKGDYWQGAVFGTQVRGTYWFTNERILFRGGFGVELDLPYSEIASIGACNVGAAVKLIPTGIKVIMRDGKKYRLSLMKRKTLIEMLHQKLTF